jgi:protein-tyrosine phosphatase
MSEDSMRRIGERPLWIGTAREARDIRAVLDAGIEAIVDLAVEEPPIQTTRELVYFRVPLVDGEGNSTSLLTLATEAVGMLARGGTPTLVSCGAGMSRSPAVVAAALAKLDYRPPDEVLAEIAGGGPADVQPGLWREVIRSLRG